MAALTWFTLIGLVLAAVLIARLVRSRSAKTFDTFMHRRDATSSVSGHAELVDGSRHLAVALTLSDKTIYYQNSDVDSSIPLDYVREIEYDNELMTGKAVEKGQVLRLHCDSQIYEFVLPLSEASQWRAQLPSTRQV